ncbi:hypothetical protein BJV78DRAFT_1171425 [Lactifluus subvellereus]|nr:hypothetical protein BJV78DRAFT_1171425 [Lactifluus subvellereus]
MSGTMNPPWIADYLINIAETYGSNLSSVPVHIKPGKKVQLLKFLTFRQFVEDDCIWAYVSDKHQQIPVRFSRYAIAEYAKANLPGSQGKKLTQQRSAIATIKSFKPIFQRIPTGSVGKMTIVETLALNVDYVKIVGSAGEPEFGSPRTLETHGDINEWMEGLRAGDGSGNILKLRKERRLAQERGEGSATGTSAAHEQSGGSSGRHLHATGSKVDALQSDRKAHAEQGDWRESIAKRPLLFYKRPIANGSTASNPAATRTRKENGDHLLPGKRKSKPGKGPLDLDSSPAIMQAIDSGSPARSQRQTTPSEWPSSPLAEWPISPPSTPPLFTQNQPQAVSEQSVRVPEPVVNNNARQTSTIAQQALSNDLASTLTAPAPAQKRRQSLPPPSFSPTYSSALFTTNLRNKASSLPSDVFGSRVSNTRRVPPPSLKNTKEACGEVLVPGSDSGSPGARSSCHENSSPLAPLRATIAAASEHGPASPRVSSSPERVNKTYDEQNSIPGREPNQDLDNMQLDGFSRMAVNGSTESAHGNGIRTRNEGGINNGEVVKSPLPSPGPGGSDEQLPPSSIPIYSQSPTWHRSTLLVEETVAIEYNTTPPDLPMVTAKRARSPSPSPPRSKRPRLMSRETVSRNHQVYGTTPRRVFDEELLKIGIEVDLREYDDNPLPYPWGERMSGLNLRSQDHPLLITNSKLAEIWKSVCKSRGGCKK